MKKWLLSLLLLSFPFALKVNVTPATSLVEDHAYVISAIGLSGSGTVNYISGDSTISENGTYKLAPQVIVYDGTTKFVGTATNFTGCFNDIKYVDSRPSGGCGILKVENITSENIKAGVTVSYGLENNTLTSITGTFTSDANAYASGILSGLSAYVNGSKITGTMANQGAVSKSLSPGGSYTIPAGYHNGSGKVTANSDSNLVAGNIRSGVSIFGVTGNYTGDYSHIEWAANDTNYDNTFKLSSGTYKFVATANSGTSCEANRYVVLYKNGTQIAETGDCSLQADAGAQWEIHSSRSYVNTQFSCSSSDSIRVVSAGGNGNKSGASFAIYKIG